MRPGAAFPIVCQLGDMLQARERAGRHGWRDAKALVVLVAESGDWNGASCLADALGIGPERQEVIFREVYGDDFPMPTRTPPAAAASGNVHHLPERRLA